MQWVIESSTRLARAYLLRLLAELPAGVDTLVFAKPVSDPRVDAMLDRFDGLDVDGLVAVAPVHEAVKQVRDGIVEAGLDRSTVVEVAGPVIITRVALARALERSNDVEVDPVTIVAADGGRVVVYRE